MVLNPPSSPGAPLLDSTNTRASLAQSHTQVFCSLLPFPPVGLQLKRPDAEGDKRATKRAKTRANENANDTADQGVDGNDSDDDTLTDCPVRIARRSHAFRALTACASGLRSRRPNWPQLSTLPILQSFVSQKHDVYRCQSESDDSFLTIPYACAYSNYAKRGETPLLAVGTEQGSVHIINTAKRHPWNAEPQRTVLRPHNNAIFDVKWSRTSNLLATASGDKSTRISCPTSERTLHTLCGHMSTVKCVAWDPAHHSVLSTGGRDGAVLIWDLRVPGGDGDDGDDGIDVEGMCRPVVTILAAHGEDKAKGRKSKAQRPQRSITGLMYPDGEPYGIVSSGAFDGVLRYWDLRLPKQKSRSTKPKVPIAVNTTLTDPTAHGSRRPRGICSLTQGTGPTAGLIFALGADSRIHTYGLPTLEPLMRKAYTHPNMQTNSFYVGLVTSPCGRWLASGCAGSGGSAFLFDVEDAHRPGPTNATGSVQLCGQVGEVGALDWTNDTLATCADDGTVRTWRPNVEVYKECLANKENARWDWHWALPAHNTVGVESGSAENATSNGELSDSL